MPHHYVFSMKKKVLTRLNALIATMLAFLGVNGCKNFTPGGIGEVECKYGIPYSEVFAQGQVVDEDEQPIEGIRVSYLSSEGYGETITNTQGEFELAVWQSFAPDSAKLVAEDVDGEEHGVFASDTINLKMEYSQSGNNGWHMGDARLENVRIQLHHRQSDETK